MSNEVSWQVELAVTPGELDSFRALTREMVDYAKREAGVLIYERFISDDGSVVYIYERYADSPSAVSHLQAFVTKYSDRFAALVERKRFTVFGIPSDELKLILDEFGVEYVRPLDGFSLSGS